MHSHAHRGHCRPSFAAQAEAHHYWGGDAGGSFGVRRPLRFLAWRLELDEAQVAKLAAVLNALKTERAQAAVDDRRALTAYADAFAAEILMPAHEIASELEPVNQPHLAQLKIR